MNDIIELSPTTYAEVTGTGETQMIHVHQNTSGANERVVTISKEQLAKLVVRLG